MNRLTCQLTAGIFIDIAANASWESTASILTKRGCDKLYWVYIIECNDGTLYTGWTNDLAKRITKHNEGLGAKYTRARYPVVLKYSEEYATKSVAMRREYYIKQMSRSAKLALIRTS